jgi:predicted ATPase
MIGNLLFALAIQEDGEEWMLFVAADHLNSCSIRGGDSLQLARLNLCCGEKANSVAAYVPASVYLRLAIKSLRKIDNHWACQYDLSLRIFRALCDVELCLGNFVSGDELAREVIGKAQNLQDRLPTFLSLAIAKGRQDQHGEAYELCQRALLDMKAVPKRHHAFHIFKDNFLIKRKLKRYSDYDILLFPRLKNERKKAIVQFLAEGQLRAYYCGDMVAYMFCCLRGLRIAFKYGISTASAYAFAAYGLFLDSVCGDHRGALRMARVARQILTRVEDTVETKSNKALALTVLSYYIEAWSCSRDHVLSTCHLAHQVISSFRVHRSYQLFTSDFYCASRPEWKVATSK